MVERLWTLRLHLLLWKNRIAASFGFVAACGRDWYVVLVLIQMAWLVTIRGKQTKVRQPFIEEHRSGKKLMLFMILLLLIPWCSAEPYIEKLWSDVELGRHGVIAIGGLFRGTAL